MVDIPRSPGRRALSPQGPQARMRISQDFTAGLRAQRDAVNEFRGTVADGQKLLLQQQEDKERSELTDADATLSKRENDLLYHKDTGAFNKRGKNAEYLREEVGEKYNETVKDIEATITTPRARQAFKQRAAGRYGDVDRNVQRHVSQEMGRHDEEVTKNYIEAEYNAAITAGVDEFVASGNRDVIEKSLGRQQGALLKHGMKYGMDPKVLADRQDEVVSRTHRAVLTRLLEGGNDLVAKEYLETYRGEFVGEDLGAAERMTKASSSLGEAQRTTDELARLPSLSEAREALKGRKLSPEIREKADSMLTREFALKERAADEFHDKEMAGAVNDIVNNFEAGKRAYNQSQILSTKPVTAEFLVGPQRWDSLSGADHIKLTGLVEDLYKPEGIKTKANLFAKLHGMTQEQLSGYSEEKFISEFLTGLGKEDYNHARKLWEESKKGVEAKAFKSLKGDSEIIFDAMRRASLGGLAETDTLATIGRTSRGKLVDPDGDAKAAIYKKVWDAVEMKRQAYYDLKKENPDDIKMKEFAAGAAMALTREVEFKQKLMGWDPLWPDRAVKLIDLTPDDLKSSEMVVPPPFLKELHNMAASEPGLIPKGMGIEAYRKAHAERVNLAFLASINGEKDWGNILKILKGE